MPTPAASGSLQWIDMSNWDHEPIPERQWAIREPRSDQSGSAILRQRCCRQEHHRAYERRRARHGEKTGSAQSPNKVRRSTSEDDVDEIHIRLANIASHYGVTLIALRSLRY